ncbi:Hypothetical protein HDN1F_10000 [gamma proteobacterium HdN1]|nr:Hypothetical protein HDN1F_10000 [gamma proteobacterium HdN1]
MKSLRSIRRLKNAAAQLLSVSVLAYSAHCPAAEWAGWINGEGRYYAQTGEQVEEQVYPSVAAQLEFSHTFNAQDQLTAVLFARGERVDDEGNFADVREFLWLHSTDAYQFRAGIGQVSWGVNELFKITDLINQKDRAELPYQRKLGQPMMSFSFYAGEDLVELYALEGLRSAWYPGKDGRLRYPIMVDTDKEEYEWGATGRLDLAGRWKTTRWNTEFALSHFYGVTRDPYFIFNYDFNHPRMIPVYEKVNQSSLEMQKVIGDVLMRAEFTYQTGSLEPFKSVAGGFEYTFGSLFDSDLDLTWYVEGIWDSRKHIYGTLLDHDVGIAARLALNDERDSNLVLGVIADTKYNEAFGTVFWSNSFGQSWSLNVTGQYFYANDHRYTPDRFMPFFEKLVQENPASPESIDKLLGMIGGVTINKKHYARIVQFINDLRQQGYWDGIKTETVPQTLFDLLRISDNSQKMNLIERGSNIQIDIYYHF